MNDEEVLRTHKVVPQGGKQHESQTATTAKPRMRTMMRMTKTRRKSTYVEDGVCGSEVYDAGG